MWFTGVEKGLAQIHQHTVQYQHYTQVHHVATAHIYWRFDSSCPEAAWQGGAALRYGVLTRDILRSHAVRTQRCCSS